LLVVDASPEPLSSLVEGLRARGTAVVTAVDAASALAAAERHGVDACVLDLMLLPCGGLDVCRQLRRLDREMDIVGITGPSEPHPVGEIAREGVGVYLRKPFEVTSLLFALVKARSNALGAHS
jgi:DNA-binding response OmpR family regulator